MRADLLTGGEHPTTGKQGNAQDRHGTDGRKLISMSRRRARREDGREREVHLNSYTADFV